MKSLKKKMKKLIMNKKKIYRLISLALIVALFSSCRNNREADEAIHIFFIGVLQIINILLFGSTSLIFSILGFTQAKHGLRITGGILTGVFALITLLSFAGLQEWHPRHYLIYTIFGIEFIMLIAAFIFTIKKPVAQVPKPAQQAANQQTLDDIINEEEEIV